MSIKFTASIVLTIITVLCITLVRFKFDSQHKTVPQNVNAAFKVVHLSPDKKEEPQATYKIGEIRSEKEEVFPNSKIEGHPTIEKEEVLSSNQIDESQFQDVEQRSQNPEPPELLTRENLIEEPEFVDAAEINLSTEDMELELTDLLFHYDISDEKIDQIFDAIRAGSEADVEASDPSYDYPDRIRAILRLIKQSDINVEQITTMINDIFPS